jgi:transposase
VYQQLDRSAVKALSKRGLSYSEIAEQLGCDRRTVKRILATPVDKTYQREGPGSQVDPFKPHILEWLGKKEKVPIERMLELAREAAPPYTGSRSAFFARVKQFRNEWELDKADRFIRFEGLPGEYAQVDWGEVRNFPFLREEGCTRYFLAVRLKFSRLAYVEFTTNMTLETLIRGMLRAFESFGGVAWVSVFDNMKTVTTGRDEHKRPIWNATFLKFMGELDCHPEACWPQSGNQKGAVENLVGWVKSSFLPERKFVDDADLAHQASAWLARTNSEVSQAHGQIPLEVHRTEEQQKLTPLIETASEYGLLRIVKTGPDSLVHIDSNRYGVPVSYAERPLTARIRERFIEFYDGVKQVARHWRRPGRVFRAITIPEHFEPLFKKKPRARVMVYRDHLIEQDPSLAAYIATLCRRYRGKFGPHILQIYALWRTYGSEQLGAACALASEHEAYGADYLASLLKAPRPVQVPQSLELAEVPSQGAVDRDLAVYESYVERTGCDRG